METVVCCAILAALFAVAVAMDAPGQRRLRERQAREVAEIMKARGERMYSQCTNADLERFRRRTA